MACAQCTASPPLPPPPAPTAPPRVVHTHSLTAPPLPPPSPVHPQSEMRLLKLYESGLPAWAVFLPSYGCWYRPWMRRATWLFFLAATCLSMAAGFYDLYKNVPYLKAMVSSVAARMYIPAAAVFEWWGSGSGCWGAGVGAGGCAGCWYGRWCGCWGAGVGVGVGCRCGCWGGCL